MSELQWLDPVRPIFPPTSSAMDQPSGLLAVGGNLESETLINAYYQGIFPWYSENEPPLWWAPNPRATLFPMDLVINRTTEKLIRKQPFRITTNQAFTEVVRSCAETRPDETWILDEMITAYEMLHNLGHAKSVEIWQEEELVGGLYGVQIGGVFCGESMFHKRPNASKLAFICLAKTLFSRGFLMIDCQLQNPFLESLGVKEIARDVYECLLKIGRDKPLPWPQRWELGQI